MEKLDAQEAEEVQAILPAVEERSYSKVAWKGR